MLTPEYLYYCADDIVALYETLNEKIVRDVVRRLVKTGEITSTAQWQIVRLQESGMLYKDILAEVAKLSNLSNSVVTELFKESGLEAVKYDNQIYSAAGLSPIPLSMSPSALNVLKAGLIKTNGYLNNLTLTTANQAQSLYIQLSTLAEMQIESGAFDYVTAIKNAVKEATMQGAWINYPTGHRDRLDVAIRRAVLTGVGQTAAQISLSNADEMGCDLVETTAHSGARPSHVTWQGKVFSRSGKNPKYPPFSQTGYGSGAGLCGWNCRHSFFPFFEGLSESAYSRDQLKGYENEQVTYNGKKMSTYDASQQQRAMERRIRDTKRKLVGYDEANRNGLDMGKEFNNASVLLKGQEAKLKDFCKQTGLDKQSPRVQTNGFGHSQAQKAVWANKKILQKLNERRIINVAEDFSRNNPIKLSDGTSTYLIRDSEITDIEIFAGKGSKKDLRVKDFLVKNYGGKADEWQHTKGHGYVNVLDGKRKANIHWFEEKTVGIVEMRLKGWSKK